MTEDEARIVKTTHFFDSTEQLELSLNDQTKELLNRKLDNMAKEYTRKLEVLRDANQKYFMQIMKFKLLNEAEVNFEDMKADEMVKRLLIVSTDPNEIWESFELW